MRVGVPRPEDGAHDHPPPPVHSPRSLRQVLVRRRRSTGHAPRPRTRTLLLVLFALVFVTSLTNAAKADHIVGMPCSSCASHDNWPRIDTKRPALRQGGNDEPLRLRAERRADGPPHVRHPARPRRLGRPLGRLRPQRPARVAGRPHLRRRRRGLHLRLARQEPDQRRRRERRDLRPLRARRPRLRPGPRHLPRRPLAQAPLHLQELREGRLPHRVAARRRAQAAAVAALATPPACRRPSTAPSGPTPSGARQGSGRAAGRRTPACGAGDAAQDGGDPPPGPAHRVLDRRERARPVRAAPAPPAARA